MLKISNTYFDSKQDAKIPIVLCRIETQRTSYIFTRRMLNSTEYGSISGISLWDGSVNTGDGGTFGGLPVSQIEARVLQFGSVGRSLVTNAKDLPSSLSQSQIGSYSISMDNQDGFFSSLLGDDQSEPLLGQKLKILQGFKGDSYGDFVNLFEGVITQVGWTNSKCRITAEDTSTIFPSSASDEGATVYAVRGTGASEMAEEQFTAAQCVNFLSDDTWLFTSNLIKDDLSDAGIIFEIENTRYSHPVLQIGINASNYPYVTVGTSVEGAGRSTTTYTSTTALTASDILAQLNLRVFFDDVNDEVTFTIAGASTTVAAATDYDRTGTFDNIIRLGDGFDGDIQNWIWNSQHYWVNNLGDNTLVDVPDVIGSLDIALTSGAWVEWPSI
jgi:hypothetical protein